MAKLTNEQWADVRAAWESDPREGFQWLVEELGLAVSRPAVSRRAENERWAKRRKAASHGSNKEKKTPRKVTQRVTPELTPTLEKVTHEVTQKVTQAPENVTQKSYADAQKNVNLGEKNSTNNSKWGGFDRTAGRPEKYQLYYAEEAYKLCLGFGATDAQLADWFGVCEQTINNWKVTHPEFLESIKQGKVIADANVARALYERATGCSHPDVHVAVWQGEVIITPVTKHYPPDVGAAKYWLNNRQPERWRNQVEVEVNTTITKPNVAELDAIYAAGMEKIQQSREAMRLRRLELAQEQDVLTVQTRDTEN